MPCAEVRADKVEAVTFLVRQSKPPSVQKGRNFFDIVGHSHRRSNLVTLRRRPEYGGRGTIGKIAIIGTATSSKMALVEVMTRCVLKTDCLIVARIAKPTKIISEQGKEQPTSKRVGRKLRIEKKGRRKLKCEQEFDRELVALL